MAKLIARMLPFLGSFLAFADEVKDAPIPTEMNWVGIALFGLVFFGGTAGFIFAVWWKSRGKKNDQNAPEN
ncbi:MAG: hypothetical protein EBT83_00850 [Betaproteobacteria bacterium]|jgi:hypothetical protein|nr:hypothetical protein [Betaproteobacteria bacterium]